MYARSLGTDVKTNDDDDNEGRKKVKVNRFDRATPYGCHVNKSLAALAIFQGEGLLNFIQKRLARTLIIWWREDLKRVSRVKPILQSTITSADSSSA